jgi:hypothetical protein
MGAVAENAAARMAAHMLLLFLFISSRLVDFSRA